MPKTGFLVIGVISSLCQNLTIPMALQGQSLALHFSHAINRYWGGGYKLLVYLQEKMNEVELFLFTVIYIQ